MRRWLVTLVGLCIAVTLGNACGSRSAAPLSAVEPDGAQATPAAGLPQLSALPEPLKRLSLTTPGYYALPLADELSSARAVPTAESLRLDAAGGLAYAVYGVYGFDGDNGPLSARIETGSITGEYFVAFSNHTQGCWVTAGPFTGSTEAAIPNPGGLRLPEAFVSPTGACYVAVLAAAGNAVTVTGLSLGVQGGLHGPGPVSNVKLSGGEGGLLISWSASADYSRPDFAGYLLERAPLLLGDYVALSAEPLTQAYCVDTTALPGLTYRFRICSADVSGLRSAWTTCSGGPTPGALPDPVALLKLPRGPVSGPVAVTFDLSASFDPNGEAISSYSLDFGGRPAAVSSAQPLLTMTLQPGCYQVTATVTTAGVPPREGSSVWRMLVYPQWQEAPVVVREPTPPVGLGESRLDHLRGLRHPDTDYTLLIGEDRAMDSLALWVGALGAQQLKRLPLYTGVDYIGEPVAVGQPIYAPFATGEGFYLAGTDGQSTFCSRIGDRSALAPIAAATDGDRIWLLYTQNDGGMLDLVVTTLNSELPQAVLASDLGSLGGVDAVYNAAAGALDIVYSDSDSTEWLRWDVAAQTAQASASLAAAVADAVDVELDTTTDRPAVLYSFDQRHRYSELDELGAWLPEELVDDSGTNFSPADLLVHDGQKLCYFAGYTGQACLLRREGAATWTQANIVSFSFNSGYGVALLDPPAASADLAQVADVAVEGTLYLAALHGDGTDTVDWSLPATCGQGFDMHAAAAADGLHAVWRDSVTGAVEHYMSLDGGASWVDAGQLGTALSNLDLAALADGTLFMSAFDGSNAVLNVWDGAAWQNRWYDATDSARRPLLSHDPAELVKWVAYDPWSGALHFVSGSETEGYGEVTAVSSATPVWGGVLGGMKPDSLCFTLTGGAQLDEGWLGLYGFGSGTAQLAVQPQLDDPLDLLNLPAAQGRSLAAVTYRSGTGGALTQSFSSILGAATRPLRYEAPDGASPQLSELPFGAWLQLSDLGQAYGTEARRTVSSAQAASATGVTLLQSWDGSESYFAWSNFGDWQELPLPAGLDHAAAPELLVGMDGRWHIVYKDWAADRVMCLSTL